VTQDSGLVERERSWLLPYRHRRVVDVRLGDRITIVLEGDVRVEFTTATLTRGSLRAPGAVPLPIAPGGAHLADVLSLAGAGVASSVAFKDGSLRLVVSTGVHLNIRPFAGDGEWSARGPGDIHLVGRSDGVLLPAD
jgi:hypothetical protein